MFVELTNPANLSKIKFTVGNVYRPPHATVAQLKLFINYFLQRLTMVNSRETIFVYGDYNINLLSLNTDDHTGCYFDGILSYSFLPTLTLLTSKQKETQQFLKKESSGLINIKNTLRKTITQAKKNTFLIISPDM